MPMGIKFRMPKLGGNAFFKSLGDEMLQTLGLFMHLLNHVFVPVSVYVFDCIFCFLVIVRVFIGLPSHADGGR